MEAEQESSSSSDLEPQPQLYSFNFSSIENFKPLQIEQLFIGTITLGSLYLYPLVQESKYLGDINFDKKKQKALAQVYCKDKRCFIRFNDTVPNYFDFDFTGFLFKEIIDKNFVQEIVILCDLTTDESLTQQISGLYTSKCNSKKEFPLLPQNFSLESLEAQLMMYAQMNQLNAKCFIVKKDSYELDPKDLKKFEPLNQYYPELGKQREEKEYSVIIKNGAKKFNSIKQMLYL